MREIDRASEETEAADATYATRTGEAPGEDLTQLERGVPIDRYVILDRLGVGGMGAVYAAYDADLDRKVALKLLLHGGGPGASSSTGPGRMLREAQAMAKLSHRNVIAVHDVGTHHDGVFVAMEFVDGGTLREWMDAGPHPWRAVLERFVAAGRGLAAAHAVGLVHRDFKPANVLLGVDGRVRVADFGLARRTGADRVPSEEQSGPTEKVATGGLGARSARDEVFVSHGSARAQGPATQSLAGIARARATGAVDVEQLETGGDSLSLRLTRTGAQVGTPAYMAPEQYLGAELDARADQFAFCVTLWEALYGERPFAGGTPHAILFQISQGKLREPPRSRKVPAHLRRALIRGLASAPEERWPDMATLLRELQRDPGARWRRVGLSALTVAALASLVALVVLDEDHEPVAAPPVCTGVDVALGATWTADGREAIERRAAELGHAWTGQALVRMIPRIDAWADAWREAWTDACEATRVRGEQSEELLDRRMLCLERRRSRVANLIEQLGEADEELIERAPQVLDELGELSSCADAETLMAVVPPPADPRRRAEVEALTAELDAIHGLYLAGKYDEAAAALATIAARAEATGHRPLLMDLRWKRGLLLEQEGAATAEAELARALADALAVADDRNAARIIKAMASHMVDAGGREHEALRWLELAEALIDRLGGNDDLLLGHLGITRSNILRKLGDYEAARSAAETALTHYMAVHGPDHPRVGDALHTLGIAEYHLGHRDEARESLERARALWTDELGADHPRARAALIALGVLARERGDREAARRHLGEALRTKLRVFGPDHPETASALSNYAISQLDLGRYEDAVALLEEAMAQYEAHYGPDNLYVGHAASNLAMARSKAGDHEGALAAAERGLAIVTAVREPGHPEIPVAYAIRGEVQLDRGRLAAAHADLRRALDLYLEALGPEHPTLLEAYYNLADVEHRRGHPERALAWLERTEAIPLGDAPDRAEQARRELLFAQLYAATDRDRAEALTRARRARALLVEHGESPRLSIAEVDEIIAALANER